MKLIQTGRVVTGLIVMAALLASSFVALAGQPESATVEDTPIVDAEWTIMVYLDADNSLEVNGYQDLAEMERVASNNGVNVIVLFDAYTTFSGSHWFYIEPRSDHIADDGVTIDCDCEEIAGGCPGELNMADYETLKEFTETAAAFAPADKYFLDLWNHGGGWWAICVDDTADPLPSGSADRLQMDEVAAAIEDSGVYLDVIDYDACFMGMVEVAYENVDIADYMVASVTTEPGTGYNYTMMLSMIEGLPVKDAYSVSKATVDAYVAHYDAFSDAGVGGYPYVSSSVFDLDKVENLVGVGRADAGMDALGKVLLDYADDYYLRGAIQSSESRTPQLQFENEQFPFIDIGYFASLLQEKMPDDAADIASKTLELLKLAVPYCNSVTSDTDAPLKTYGMSVYYTICWGHLYESYLNCDLDFVDETSWDEFLFAFSQVYIFEK